MVIDRRTVLAALLAGAFAPRVAVAARRDVYVSCRLDAEQNASVSCFDENGHELFATSLPARGHDTLERPGAGEVIVFARRPGAWMMVIDAATGTIRSSVAASPHRQFCGHGVFSKDGTLLYATENDDETNQGVIGIYDAKAAYRRVGEVPSFGVGPHDITLSPDGRDLFIANGGMRTDLKTGRDFLLETDAPPNLVRFDLRANTRRDVIELDSQLRKLSIRHLDAQQDGTVAFGCQHQGEADDLPPLVGLWTKSGKTEFLASEDTALARMKNYVGSVAFNADGTLLAATSPHGGQVMLWSMAERRFLTAVTKTDVCGIAPIADGFVATSGNSGVQEIGHDGALEGEPRLLGFVWDNHLLQLKG
ncbi:DUF1513 domain-containing protein [Aestuariivirga sp.]|uniref:DUF1513 domain-containing protein n=1 Tax=Aestuariivirga sp. TaxID=2650926 RepID=UPI0039E56E0E